MQINNTVDHAGSLQIKTSPDEGAYIRNVWFKDLQLGEIGDKLIVIWMGDGDGPPAHPMTNISGIHYENITRLPGAPKGAAMREKPASNCISISRVSTPRLSKTVR